MKNLICLLIIVLLVSPLWPQQKKETLAILDFNVVSGISPKESVTLTNIFRSEMFKTGRFDVLERNDMESILKEQAFTLTGACNSAECAVEIGQLLSAEKMVIGDFGKVGETFSITIRLVNVSTAKMEMVLDERFKGDPETFLEIVKKMAQQLSRYSIINSVLLGKWNARFNRTGMDKNIGNVKFSNTDKSRNLNLV